MSPRRGGSGWIARVALIGGSLVIVFGVAEVALRVAWRSPTGAQAGDLRDDDLSLRDLAKPDRSGRFLGLPFRTNSRGARGPEFDAEPAEGVIRLLFTGDSVTMGWRVLEEDAYPSVVERILHERGVPGGRRVEIVNVGLAGVNVDGAMDRLEAGADAYAPDLFVYGFTINDIEGPAYRKKHSSKAAMALMRRHNRYAESPSFVVRFLWPRVSALQERLSPTLTPYSETLHDNYFANPEAWRAVEAGLDRFAALADARGVCAQLLIHVELDDLDPETHPYLDIYARIESAARRRGITTTQSFPAFAGRDAEALKAAFLDSHPGVEGHRLLATSLVDGLLALPASCFEPAGGADGGP